MIENAQLIEPIIFGTMIVYAGKQAANARNEYVQCRELQRANPDDEYSIKDLIGWRANDYCSPGQCVGATLSYVADIFSSK